MHVSSGRLLADSLPPCKLAFPNPENEIHDICTVCEVICWMESQSLVGLLSGALLHIDSNSRSDCYSRDKYFETFQLFSQFQIKNL